MKYLILAILLVFKVHATLIMETIYDHKLSLHQTETQYLVEEIYNKYQVIDMEKSGLLELQGWYNDVVNRINTVIKKTRNFLI